MTFNILFPSLIVASGMAIATAMPATAASLAPGTTDVYQFENVESSNTAGDSFSNKLTFQVSAAQEDSVLFLFSSQRNDGFSYYVSQIYFSFMGAGPNPLSLPVKLNVNNSLLLGGAYKATSTDQLGGLRAAGFTDDNTFFGATYSAESSRLTPRRRLGIEFTGTFASVLDALASNDLRIGINVDGLPGGQSDSFVTSNLEIEAPIVDEPVVEEPIVEEPIVDEPVVDEPVVEEPIVEEPIVEEPIVDDPVVEEPGETPQDSGSAGEQAGGDAPIAEPPGEDVAQTPVEEVPEPLTILGSGLAIGFGAWFRRKHKQA